MYLILAIPTGNTLVALQLLLADVLVEASLSKLIMFSVLFSIFIFYFGIRVHKTRFFYLIPNTCICTLDVNRHYIEIVTATTHQEKGIITLESKGTVLPALHGKGNKCDKNVKYKRTNALSLWLHF